MFNDRLAGDHLYGKQLFTWMSLAMSLMASFYAVFFPTSYLGWDLGLNWVSFWGVPYLLFHKSQSNARFMLPYYVQLLFTVQSDQST